MMRRGSSRPENKVKSDDNKIKKKKERKIK
jgi:hypothetical protein